MVMIILLELNTAQEWNSLFSQGVSVETLDQCTYIHVGAIVITCYQLTSTLNFTFGVISFILVLFEI